MKEYVTCLTLRIAPERMAEFEAMMEVEAPLTREFDGCERFEAYADQSTPGVVLFFERWKSKEHEQRYTRWRTDRGDMQRLGAFFSASPTSTVLREFRDTKNPAPSGSNGSPASTNT